MKNHEILNLLILAANRTHPHLTVHLFIWIGSGYYAIVNSSKNDIYDGKAILTSREIEKPKTMSFRYFMDGTNVETLAVTVKALAKETVWVRYGSQVRNVWRKACLLFDKSDYRQGYKVSVGLNK